MVMACLLYTSIVGLIARARGGSAKEAEITVQSAEAAKGSISATVVGTGTLAGGVSTDVVVPAGIKVKEVLVESGDMVEAGQILATLDEASIASQLLEVKESMEEVQMCIRDSQSIGTLFMAGIVPGFLIAMLLILVSSVICRKRGYKGNGKAFSLKNLLKAIWDAKWALLVPVIILGGIYGGVFTPTEAAVVAVVYGIFVGKFVYKELKFLSLIHI